MDEKSINPWRSMGYMDLMGFNGNDDLMGLMIYPQFNIDSTRNLFRKQLAVSVEHLPPIHGVPWNGEIMGSQWILQVQLHEIHRSYMILYDLSVVKAHHEKSMKPHHEKKNLSNSSYSSETPIIPWISTHFPTIFPHLPLPFGNRVARSPDFAHAQWSASAAVNPAVFVGGFYWGHGNVYHGYFYFNEKYGKILGCHGKNIRI